MYKIVDYTMRMQEEWDRFVSASKNGLFFFQRKFVDYHAEKIEDKSVMIFEGDELIGLLPLAKGPSKTLVSHSGLTFGGLIYRNGLDLEKLEEILRAIFLYLKDQFVDRVVIKQPPAIYNSDAYNELKFAYFKNGGHIKDVYPTSYIDFNEPSTWQQRRKRQANKALKKNIEIKIDNDFCSFWNEILIPNLQLRYHRNPVHSIEEIQLLQKRFPEQILQVNAYYLGKICTGITIFKFEGVVKLQYISSNELGKSYGALDLIMKNLQLPDFLGNQIIDMGTSMIPETERINRGVFDWKMGFGAKITLYETYSFVL